MVEILWEKSKKVGNTTIYVRAFTDGTLKCWAEPSTIDALEYVKGILEKYNIPYSQTGDTLSQA